VLMCCACDSAYAIALPAPVASIAVVHDKSSPHRRVQRASHEPGDDPCRMLARYSTHAFHQSSILGYHTMAVRAHGARNMHQHTSPPKTDATPLCVAGRVYALTDTHHFCACDSRTIVTICSSVYLLFFISPPVSLGTQVITGPIFPTHSMSTSHPLKLYACLPRNACVEISKLTSSRSLCALF